MKKVTKKIILWEWENGCIRHKEITFYGDSIVKERYIKKTYAQEDLDTFFRTEQTIPLPSDLPPWPHG
jgi:hypothetical protein